MTVTLQTGYDQFEMRISSVGNNTICKCERSVVNSEVDRPDAVKIGHIPSVSTGVAFEMDKNTFYELSAPA